MFARKNILVVLVILAALMSAALGWADDVPGAIHGLKRFRDSTNGNSVGLCSQFYDSAEKGNTSGLKGCVTQQEGVQQRQAEQTSTALGAALTKDTFRGVNPAEVAALINDPEVKAAFKAGVARGRSTQIDKPVWTEAEQKFNEKLKGLVCKETNLSASKCAALNVGGVFTPAFDLVNTQNTLRDIQQIKQGLGMVTPPAGSGGASVAGKTDVAKTVAQGSPKKLKKGKPGNSDSSSSDSDDAVGVSSALGNQVMSELGAAYGKDKTVKKEDCGFIPISGTLCKGAKYYSDESGLKLIDDVFYELNKPDLVSDIKQFLGDLFMENYLQQVVMDGDVANLGTRVEELGKAASCMGGVSAAKAMAAKIPNFSAVPEGSEIYGKVAQSRQSEMVLASHCSDAIEDRLAALRQELGLEFTNSKGKTESTEAHALITEEDMEILYGDGKSESAVGAVGQGARKVGVAVLDGLLSGPGLRQFLKEFPAVNHFKEMGKAKCSGLSTLANSGDMANQNQKPDYDENGFDKNSGASRISYCRNVMSEFSALSEELNGLYSSYPEMGDLIPGGKGKTVKSSLAKASSELHPRVKGYDLNFNRKNNSELLDANGGLNSCMNRFLKDPAKPQEGFVPVGEKALAAAAAGVSQTNKTRQGTFLAQLRTICKNPEEYVEAAVSNPALMGAYFNCERKPFGALYGALGFSAETASVFPKEFLPARIDAKTCDSRTNSARLACRMKTKATDTQKMKELAGHLIGVGMDSFFLAGGVFGGAGGAAGKLTTKVVAKNVLHNSVVGFGMMEAMGLMGPSQRQILDQISRDKAVYYGGGGGDSSTLGNATASEEKIAKSTPHLDNIYKSIGMALPFSFHGGAPKVETVKYKMPAPDVANLGRAIRDNKIDIRSVEEDLAKWKADLTREKRTEAPGREAGDAKARWARIQGNIDAIQGIVDAEKASQATARRGTIDGARTAALDAAHQEVASAGKVKGGSKKKIDAGKRFRDEAVLVDKAMADRESAQLAGDAERVKALDAKIQGHLKKIDGIAKGDSNLVAAAATVRKAAVESERILEPEFAKLKGEKPLHEMSAEHIAEVKAKYKEVLEDAHSKFPGEEIEALQIVDILANRDKMSVKDIKEYFAKLYREGCKR